MNSVVLTPRSAKPEDEPLLSTLVDYTMLLSILLAQSDLNDADKKVLQHHLDCLGLEAKLLRLDIEVRLNPKLLSCVEDVIDVA